VARKLILLVEDNIAEATLMRIALHEHGVTADVRTARDGAEALEMLASADGNGDALPSVVFLDLKMPKMSGLEVLKSVRSQERTRMLPIVILSASGHLEDIRDAYLLGANSYIRKPVNFDTFSELVRQLSSYWLGLNEPAPWYNGHPA
jgi:two-component system response regulator